jgi:endonuclease
MPIYEKPTKVLMQEWATQHLVPGQIFKKSEPIQWFADHYPKIKSNTVGLHVEGMSINNPTRRHHPGIRAGRGFDLFYKLGPNQFRLWARDSDPAPKYKDDFDKPAVDGEDDPLEPDEPGITKEFAFERDLRNYLAKNLSLIEPGLKLYEEEEIVGVEFPVGGRFIDILAVDKDDRYVVIELKVSRGYDRVLGQLLRYMAWVKQNMDATRPVRGVIVGNEITSDLKLAASLIPDVKLLEYELSLKLRPA